MPDAAQGLDAMVEHLRATRPWVRLLGILAFVGSGFAVLGGLSMFAMGSFIPSSPGLPAGTFGPALGSFYLFFAVLYLVPAVYLHRYANALDVVVHSRNEAAIIVALDRQRAFWKCVGLFALVSIGLTFLVIAGGIVVGVASAMR